MDLTCTLVLLILSCTVFVNGCPDNCGCDSATFTVICSDFALSWKELVSNIPADTRQLELRKGTLLDASLGDESRLFSPHFQAESSLFLPDITKVAMSHVDIRVPLNEDAFQPITSTRELHLVFSSLKELNDATLFNDFTNLKLLNLSHNSLEELSDGMFDFLPKLTVLDLSFNKLRRLPHNVFDVVEKLESLHVNDNELKYIHPHSIGNLTSLHTLHIDSNSLETLHETALPRDKSFLTRLKLEGNPWDCNCGLVWLAALLRANASANLFYDPDSIQCHKPEHLRGQPVKSLSAEKMACEVPTIMHHPPANVSMQRVRSHWLHCNASGNPAPAIYWITPNGVFAQPNHRMYMSPRIRELVQRHNFRGVPTYRDSSIEVLANGSLYFTQVRWYYAGEYRCVAENPAGISTFSVHVKIHEVITTYVRISMVYGGLLALGFFVLSLIYASVKLLVEKTCCRQRMKEKAESIISSIEDFDFEPGDATLFEGYLSPDWSRDFFYISPRYSPPKCVTPAGGEDFESKAHIRDTLEDVRMRLHKSVEKHKEKIRTRAHRMRESSSQYMQSIRETGTIKMHNIRESSSQYVRSMRSSGTNAIQGIRESSSQYAHRVRAGVVMGVEQVKYHVQSMREFCGTGDIGQTISTVSVSTNVDMGERVEVVKQITYV